MSISLKFPDGAERSYDDGVTPLVVAEGISKSLAKKVVAAKVDGAWWDLTRPLEGGGKFELVMRDSPDGLEIIRHDAAHVMAQAVQELFPGTQVTFGRASRTGFITTSRAMNLSRSTIFRSSKTRCARLLDATSRSCGKSCRATRQSSFSS
jgi:threonyl-tRNA synthetase